MKVIFAVINTTWAVEKIRPENIQACTGFEPMTFTIPVQCSTNWATKPTGNWATKPTDSWATKPTGSWATKPTGSWATKPTGSWSGLKFFSPLFTTAQVVFITAEIAFILTSLSAIHVYDFHVITIKSKTAWLNLCAWPTQENNSPQNTRSGLSQIPATGMEACSFPILTCLLLGGRSWNLQRVLGTEVSTLTLPPLLPLLKLSREVADAKLFSLPSDRRLLLSRLDSFLVILSTVKHWMQSVQSPRRMNRFLLLRIEGVWVKRNKLNYSAG